MIEEESEEEFESGAGCAGVFVLSALVLTVVVVLYVVSPETFILVLWGGGWTAIVWAAKRTPKIDNPSPPPPVPERGSEEKPQVTMIRDQTHPNRWVILRPSRWLTADTEKTGTS